VGSCGDVAVEETVGPSPSGRTTWFLKIGVCDVASRFFRCNIDSLSSISLREVVAIAMDPPRVVRGMGTIREKG